MSCPSYTRWALLLMMTLLVATSTHVNGEQPHPHRGKVPPFAAGDPKVRLDGKARKTLSSNKPYQTQILSPDGSSGRGLVVQDVAAPTSVVWDRILDYDRYSEMVPKTVYSRNYKIQHHKKNGAQTIHTKMIVGFPMLKLTFYVKHEYQPKLHSLTWTLDYDRKSDFDDSCGYWYVVPHPDDPIHKTRVYYSVQVSMFDWVPQFVVNFMSNKALTDATGWVKKFSERKYQDMVERGDAETADATNTVKRRRKKVLQWFFATTTDGDDAVEDEAESAELTKSNDVVVRSAPSATIASNKDSMGLARYGLVMYVFALGVYNVHLYLSQ